MAKLGKESRKYFCFLLYKKPNIFSVKSRIIECMFAYSFYVDGGVLF